MRPMFARHPAVIGLVLVTVLVKLGALDAAAHGATPTLVARPLANGVPNWQPELD